MDAGDRRHRWLRRGASAAAARHRVLRFAMADERTHHVKLRLLRGYEFVAEFPDVACGASILFDEPQPLGRNAAPNAAAVLGAAVGDCLASSLAFCLRRAHVVVDDLSVDVTTHVARNEQ